jgi:uncharacterized membrane protein (UPF0127 family)
MPLLAALLFGVSATAHALPVKTLILADPSATAAVSLTVEIASTPDERRTGLMNRPAMPKDAGMLFLFPEPGQVGFWMHDTLIALDMLFISDGEVVAIHPNALPMSETVISSPPDVDMVLEVNGGWSRSHGVTPGWTVGAPPSSRSPTAAPPQGPGR